LEGWFTSGRDSAAYFVIYHTSSDGRVQVCIAQSNRIQVSFVVVSNASILNPLLILRSSRFLSRRMMSVKTMEEVDIYRTQTQLVIGWLTYNPAVVKFEITSAAARIGIDIDSFHFLLPSPSSAVDDREKGDENPENEQLKDVEYELKTLNQWEKFLDRPLRTKQNDRNSLDNTDNLTVNNASSGSLQELARHARVRRIKVSVGEVVETILTRANKEYPFSDDISNFITLFSAIVTFTPILVNPLLLSKNEPNYPWPIIYCVFSVPIVQIMCVTNCLILVLTSSFDTRRRLSAVSVLSALVRPTMMDTDPQIIFGLDGPPVSWCVSKKRKQLKREKEIIRLTKLYDSFGTGGDVENGSISSPFKSTEKRGDMKQEKEVDEQNEDDDNGEGPEEEKEIPRLSLEIPQNVYAWLYTRLVLMTFGQRMLFRINAYVAAMFALVFIVMGGLVMVILHSNTPRLVIRRPIVIQCLTLVVFLILYIMYLIWIASAVNEEYVSHRQFLSINVLKIESELAELLVQAQDKADLEAIKLQQQQGLAAKATLLRKHHSTKHMYPSSARRPSIVELDEMKRRKTLSNDADEASRHLFNSSFRGLDGDTFQKEEVKDAATGSGIQPSGDEHNYHDVGIQGEVHSTQLPTPVSSARDRLQTIDDISSMFDNNEEHRQTESYPQVNKNIALGSRLPGMASTTAPPWSASAPWLPGLDPYQMMEFEESIKALRRAMEAIDISNQQWGLKICGFDASKALLFSVLSGCFLFASTIYTALKHNSRQI
jgi:hypothetical protein